MVPDDDEEIEDEWIDAASQSEGDATASALQITQQVAGQASPARTWAQHHDFVCAACSFAYARYYLAPFSCSYRWSGAHGAPMVAPSPIGSSASKPSAQVGPTPSALAAFLCRGAVHASRFLTVTLSSRPLFSTNVRRHTADRCHARGAKEAEITAAGCPPPA